MIHRNRRPKALGLITMIAIVPIMLVITTISAMLISRVLRVQREATYRVVNTETATRLVDHLRSDAANATSVTLDESGSKLILVGQDNEDPIDYTISGDTISRVAPVSLASSISNWKFKHATIDLSLEKLPTTAGLIWVTVEYQVELRKRVIDVAKMSTAIHVGDGEVER